MERMLTGLETEYGLYIEGRGAKTQVEDSMAVVRSYPGDRRVVWDYRHESPRNDLRGFSVSHLTVDPEDAHFDEGKSYGPSEEVRSDVILPNGARFYNDHGHPEYSTPECFSLADLAAHDVHGERVVLKAAAAYAQQENVAVRVYKNNTDYHGASYGSHESYLVPRAWGFDRLYAALTPLLVTRPIVCGAGKVGFEHGKACNFQISQRADFFSERASVDTLFRRPIFNTRDEPHADPTRFARVHVIASDANMIPAATARKVGLVRIALALEAIGQVPRWELADPVKSYEEVSKDERYTFPVPLAGRSWTTAYDVIESYLAAAEATLELDSELITIIQETRFLLTHLPADPDRCAPHLDWLAKRNMLESIMADADLDWNAPELRSYDLEYHNVDREDGLYFALRDMGQIDAVELPIPSAPPTRAAVRGAALRYPELKRACWRSLTFVIDGKTQEVELQPDIKYEDVPTDADVVTFIRWIESQA